MYNTRREGAREDDPRHGVLAKRLCPMMLLLDKDLGVTRAAKHDADHVGPADQ